MTHDWRSLEPGPFRRSAQVPGADPMWVWADATGYRDLGLDARAVQAGLWCVVKRMGVFVSERHAPKAKADPKLRNAELAMPVQPERMPPAKTSSGSIPTGAVTVSTKDRVLVGVIDSGCPFASQILRNASGQGTRVLGLWNQDDEPSFSGQAFRPPGVAYGRAVNRKGLNHFMAAARVGDSLDEDHCYALAGYTAMRRRASHGAAVLSQLFASPLHGGTLQPQPGNPPKWDQVGSGALHIDSADLVFVDVPKPGLQDASSAALARYVIDGLHFILSHASIGQRVVVNISTGTSRTLHNGDSLFEQALAAAVKAAKARKIRLQIVLPAGNGNMEQRHAVLGSTGSHLTLFVPPGVESPQFVTVAWPKDANDLMLRLTPPVGPPVEVKQGQAMGLFGSDGKACCGIVSPVAAAGKDARSLLVFSPTASFNTETPLAPGGRWTIELAHDKGGRTLKKPVRFWVSRNQRNPGALARGRQADFVDWDRSHHPRAWLRYDEDDRPRTAAQNGIRRNGAATGLASAALLDPAIFVVGSLYVAGQRDKASNYSAAGAEKSGIPNVSAPGDASRAQPGLSVHGNRSGEIVRMVGTSFAAPLAARALVNNPLPKADSTAPPRVGWIRLQV